MKKYIKAGIVIKWAKYIAFAAYLIFSSNTQAQFTLCADTGRIGWGERVTIKARIGVNASENIVSLDSFPQWTDKTKKAGKTQRKQDISEKHPKQGQHNRTPRRNDRERRRKRSKTAPRQGI